MPHKRSCTLQKITFERYIFSSDNFKEVSRKIQLTDSKLKMIWITFFITSSVLDFKWSHDLWPSLLILINIPLKFLEQCSSQSQHYVQHLTGENFWCEEVCRCLDKNCEEERHKIKFQAKLDFNQSREKRSCVWSSRWYRQWKKVARNLSGRCIHKAIFKDNLPFWMAWSLTKF